MSQRKNKIELRDESLSLSSAMNLYYQDDPWYYDDYDYDGCDCPQCRPFDSHDYQYLPEDESTVILLSKRRGVYSYSSVWYGQGNKPGRMIDMRSVYSKEILRQKKIDVVLGLSAEFTKPTFADIINNVK